jgi:GntR family transcriptional regulator
MEGKSKIGSLDERSSVPLYTQLANLLRGKIVSGQWKEGDVIPSETQLIKEFGVSRGTVRQAVGNLAQQNLLYRRRGIGSIVTGTRVKQSLNEFYDLSTSFGASGMNLTVEVVGAKEQTPPTTVIQNLMLPPGAKVYWVERVLSACGAVLIVEHLFLPVELFPNMLEHDMAETNLYELFLRDYGLKVHRAQESFEMVEVCRHEAKYFGDLLVPLLQHTRVTFDEIRPFEYRRITVRGDICTYQVEIKVG